MLAGSLCKTNGTQEGETAQDACPQAAQEDLTKRMDQVIADQQAARGRANWRRGMMADNARLRAWANEQALQQPNVWRTGPFVPESASWT